MLVGVKKWLINWPWREGWFHAMLLDREQCFSWKVGCCRHMILLKFYVNLTQLMCSNNRMPPDCWPWHCPERIDDLVSYSIILTIAEYMHHYGLLAFGYLWNSYHSILEGNLKIFQVLQQCQNPWILKLCCPLWLSLFASFVQILDSHKNEHVS